MIRLVFFTILFTICTLVNVNAHTKNKLNTCIINRTYINNYEPKIFQKSNNLLRKVGGEELFCGQKILLKLKIVDKKCVPLSDARIYIWQVSCDGKYPYEPMRKKIDTSLIKITEKSSFVGSGTNISDNLGRVEFLTIRPSNRHKQGFVNIRIEHSYYGSYETRLKITNDMVQNLIDETQIVEARIVLPWENIYRRF
jgi:protocatechuate 3,4-dioxygenase beta subunit